MPSSVWPALMFNNMKFNRFKGLTAVILPDSAILSALENSASDPPMTFTRASTANPNASAEVPYASSRSSASRHFTLHLSGPQSYPACPRKGSPSRQQVRRIHCRRDAKHFMNSVGARQAEVETDA